MAMDSRPSWKLASILDRSAPGGRGKTRSKRPKRRSEKR